ncbi:beta-glucosidase [Psychrosphaera sp. B3R10]|uniref:GH1 family beta-glucosidase n=1 Tax=unclassified Psychrosphaera TaxID=2641570 RepID=UPI001C0A45C6|nr:MULTISPECIES: GH1 family beta-glucosidase [unclassified Psychrosphaera]MBU2881156.1 beta-glucosidase [Psychrosphaera sp. I2R16]MBU2988261.1 beta-glucosidase [Psychrosphaera sp. B3R10]
MNKITLPITSPMMKRQFTFGVATASFQIEGGIEHRLPCIWDTFCETDGKIADSSNGKIACDHFNKWQDDVELISSLGVDAYRLSISWPRVIKQDGTLNEEGVSFYQNLIDGLNAKNIKVFATLYHWDLPQHLEDQGGWLNRETAYKFAQYVDLVSKELGEKVHSYATFNEPFCSAFLGYEIGVHAPGKTGKANGRQAAHHILLAHGLAMPILQKNCPNSLNGIVLNFTPCYAASDSDADKQAAEYADQYINQWYIKPIMDGAYPSIIDKLGNDWAPDMQEGDLAIINCPVDFLGINYYTRLLYSAPAQDGEFYTEHDHLFPRTDIGWEIYPKALTELLVSLNSKYTLPPVYITENGAAIADQMVDGIVQDTDRINYYNGHLNAVNDAIADGVNVVGYFAWSLMDNFEWAEGYLKRFGIVYVDYDTQVRTIKQSGLAYKDLITSRGE